jgi:hypothetical protein
MSRHRRHRVSRGDAITAAKMTNVARGCTCNPDLSVWHDADGITHTSIAHDDWCPVIANGHFSDIALMPEEGL